MKTLFVSVALLSLISLTGCGTGGREAQVAGKVTYAGTIINDGVVNFLSTEKGIGAMARIESGAFELPEAITPGSYAVYVTPPPVEPPPPGTRPVAPPAAGIPLKARDPHTSGVKVSLINGANDVVIELKD